MPNYYNPYNFYPASYINGGASFAPYATPQLPIPQQSYAQGTTPKPMEWVEGEVGAKAFQMPAGWPANQPIPLWDSTDSVIYLKSWSQMGIPNPLQKLKYEMPESQTPPTLPGGQSGSAEPSNFVTKEDLESMKNELRELIRNNRYNSQGNQNQNNRKENRGGQE